MTAALAGAIAEFLSVLSGLLLIAPVIALNRHLRAIKTAQDQLAAPRTKLTRSIARELKPQLERAKIPEWSRRDQRMLIWAIGLFAAASAIKLYLAAAVALAAG